MNASRFSSCHVGVDHTNVVPTGVVGAVVETAWVSTHLALYPFGLLARSEPATGHGYSVAEWIEQATGDALSIEEGTLYPALHRLERKGWVKTEWGISDNNRRAKFYRLTPLGRAQFRALAPTWHRYAEAIAVALRATSGDAHA